MQIINLNKKMKNDKLHAHDITKYGTSKIAEEWIENGIKAVILACKGSHFTAYLGIPKDHPLAGHFYDDVPLKVHGGLTYGDFESKVLPKGYFFYGWDYGHSGDYAHYPNPMREIFEDINDKGHNWTLEEVREEVKEAMYDFRQLVLLAEAIANRSNKNK